MRAVTRVLDAIEAVVEDGVVERRVIGPERVGAVELLVFREDLIVFPLLLEDVLSATLHEVARERDTAGIGLEAGHREALIKQLQQPIEGLLVAAVWGRGEKHYVPRRVSGETLQQAIAPLAATVRADAGMGLVDDDAGRTRGREALTALLSLDVVQADDRERMDLEQALRPDDFPFQARRGRGGDGDGLDVELGAQLADPLIDEVRRAQDAEALDLAAVEEFAKDEAGLDGLADADVVGDQQANHGQAHRHQQRYELIGSRLEADARRRAERARAPPQRQAERLRQKAGALLRAAHVDLGRSEVRGLDRHPLQSRQYRQRVGLSAGERAQAKRGRVVVGQRDPFPAARTHEVAGGELDGHAATLNSDERAGAGPARGLL